MKTKKKRKPQNYVENINVRYRNKITAQQTNTSLSFTTAIRSYNLLLNFDNFQSKYIKKPEPMPNTSVNFPLSYM